MPSPLRFRLPVQGEGIEETGIGVEWSHAYQYGADAAGYSKWSRQKLYTGFSHDSEFLMVLRNRGSGGKHFWVQKSTDASTVLQITDAGLSLATALTSTVATGTAPFTVASTTKVANLNADLLDDHDSSYFATQTDLDDYLPLTGGDITGDLGVSGTLDVDGDATVDGDFDVDGDSDLQVVRLTPDPSADPQLLFRANVSRTFWGMGGSDSSTPNFRLFTLDGSLVATEQFEITETGRVNAKSMEVYSGNLIVSAGSFTLSGIANLNSDVTVGGTLNVSGFTTISDDVRITQECRIDGILDHNGAAVGFYGSSPISKPTVSGSRGGNAALQDLCSELANLGLINDSTS